MFHIKGLYHPWDQIMVLTIHGLLELHQLAISHSYVFSAALRLRPEAADMNGIFQMQGGKNWILPK